MKDVLNRDNIIIDSSVKNIEEAIDLSGALLYKNGYIEKEYIDDMHKKEKVYPSYLGYRLAIPHGFSHSDELVKKSGVAVIQSKKGIKSLEGEDINLIIAIAGRGNEHIQVLGQIALVCSETENVDKLIAANTQEEILDIFLSGLERE